MKERLIAWQEKLDAMTQRERVLVFVVAAVVLWFILQALLIDPLIKDRSLKQREITGLNIETETLRNEATMLSSELTAGVHRKQQQRRDHLLEQEAELDRRIEDSVVTMIPPQMMTEALEQVLAQDSELQLLALENLPVASIIEQGTDHPTQDSSLDQKGAVEAAEIDKLGLYKHRFVLTLRGNYLATVRYFEELNGLPWRFHWDSLNYEVTDYPNATIILQVHTVSRSEDWIGV